MLEIFEAVVLKAHVAGVVGKAVVVVAPAALCETGSVSELGAVYCLFVELLCKQLFQMLFETIMMKNLQKCQVTYLSNFRYCN